MVDLPSPNLSVTTSEAPRSELSAGDVASPYIQLGAALQKLGAGAEAVAEPLAERAGLQAVTTDANGNVKVDRWPIFGQAGFEYARAVKFAAVAEGEGAAKRADISIREKHRDDPEGYVKAADQFRDGVVKQYTDAAGPEVGITLGKIIDSQTTLTYRGLLNEKERLDLGRADASINAGIASHSDTLYALARGGVTSGPEWDREMGTIRALYDQKVGNPRLAFPKDMANYELDKLHSELQAQGLLYHVDQTYREQGLDAALAQAKTILTDTSLKLSPAQRQTIFDRARGEVRLNEYERHQSVADIDAQFKLMRENFADTGQFDPTAISELHRRYMEAGAPVKAAAVVQFGAVQQALKPAGDLPLPEQHQLADAWKGEIAAGQGSPAKKEMAAAIEAQTRRIEEGIAKDGWSFIASRFPSRVDRPPPLDFSNPQALAQGIAARGKIAALGQRIYQSSTIPALTREEIGQVQGILAMGDLPAKASIFNALSGLPESVRNATLAKIGEHSENAMVQAFGGSFLRTEPEFAMSIIRGANAAPEFRPEGAEKTKMHTEMARAVPATAVPYEARGDERSPYAMLQRAIEARYADLSMSAGDTSGKFNSRRFDTAAQDVTGGTTTVNGDTTFLPRGMTQHQFEARFYGLTDDDLRGTVATDRSGLVSPGGNRITAAQVIRSGHLEAIGNGKYLVRLNPDAEHPIYAYELPEAGDLGPSRKFVLDLTAVEPKPVPPSTAGIDIRNLQ